MKSRIQRARCVLTAAATMFLIGMLSIAALQQEGRGQRGAGQPPDPLRQLNDALQRPGAPVLTADQAKQILTLLADFRTANRPAPSSAAMTQARANYEAAMVKGDLAAASAHICGCQFFSCC